MEDSIFYKAREHKHKWELGCKEYKDWHQKRYNVKYEESFMQKFFINFIKNILMIIVSLFEGISFENIRFLRSTFSKVFFYISPTYFN